MIRTILHVLTPLVGALSIAWIAHWLACEMHIEATTARHLSNFHGEIKSGAGERFGEQLAGRLPISIETWHDHLRWAQRGGYFLSWGIGQLVVRSLWCAVIAALVILLLKPTLPLVLLSAALGLTYPFVGVRSKANEIRRLVVRNLPEVAALVAAEMAAGTSPDQAIHRAAQLPGPLSGLLKEATSLSHKTGRPLFSRLPVRGTLVETLEQARLPMLHAFATQLDLVSLKGVAGPQLMTDLATTLAREYRARVMSETKKLDSRLVMATALFFFIPFVVIILGSFMTPILQMFG